MMLSAAAFRPTDDVGRIHPVCDGDFGSMDWNERAFRRWKTDVWGMKRRRWRRVRGVNPIRLYVVHLSKQKMRF